MNDFTDVFYVIGAMIIFSILSVNTFNYIGINEEFQYQSELQQNAVVVANEVITEMRWISDKDRFNPNRGDFVGNDYPRTVTMVVGDDDEFEFDYDVDVQVNDTTIAGSNSVNKAIYVTVSSEYLEDNQKVRMRYIKTLPN